MTSFYDFDTNLAPIVRKHQPTDVPPVLYHFTDDRGLKGIVDSKELWLTHFRFTNDSAEVTYGLNLAIDQLVNATSQQQLATPGQITNDEFLRGDIPNFKPSDELLQIALATLREPQIEEGGRYQFFISCLSEQNDQLSQWRAYARDASGYAVGLSPNILISPATTEKLGKDGLGDTLDLMKVIYSKEHQLTIIDEVLKTACERIDSLFPDIPMGSRKQSILTANLWIVTALLRLALYFKHPGFSEEQEWRLILSKSKPEVATTSSFTTQTRIGPYGITPYVAVPLARSSENLRIEHVVMGPKNTAMANATQSTTGLETLFAKLDGGYPMSGVIRSQIPYR